MYDLITKLHAILDYKERRNALFIFILMLLTGIVGMTGVASILPFLDVLVSNDVIETKEYIRWLYYAFDFQDYYSFKIFLGSVVFAVVVLGIGLQALTQYITMRYGFNCGHSWSVRLMKAYFSRPYSWFLNRHSADLGKSILSEVEQVIYYTLLPFLQFLSGVVQTFFLVALLIFVNPTVSLLAFAIIGLTYIAIYWKLKRYLGFIGEKRINVNQKRFQIIQEVFGGIKEVKVSGLESGYISSFNKAALNYAKIKTHIGIISVIPGFAIQIIAFGGILIILMFLLITHEGGMLEVLPFMGMLAFSSVRLLPIIGVIYQSITKIKSGKPALDILYKDMFELSQENSGQLSANLQSGDSLAKFSNCIELNKVEYTYPKSKAPFLKDICLNIKANTTVGFVGSTGSGKSTIVDLIIGLLTPQKGELIVDGVPIVNRNVASWQRMIGYVPQHIFLTDDTIASNIAFGVKVKQVDRAAVMRAAKIAELHEFVESELEYGYDTLVGERGVRLSGGQRQRIGIARALYHNPDVLIMDEATSALDNITEQSVMSAIHTLSGKKTVILIAHRLSTVINCDNIFLMDQGKLIDQGRYKELLGSNRLFKNMVESSN